MNPYSVLLLYPDYATGDFGKDSYYTHVMAAHPAGAVEAARQECDDQAKRTGEDRLGDDLEPLLVIAGHHPALPHWLPTPDPLSTSTTPCPKNSPPSPVSNPAA